MKKSDLPKAKIGARPGVQSDISPIAFQRWFPDVKALVGDDAGATISILDPIGADIWGDGVTAKRIAAALRAIGDNPVTVNVNSPGGDFFEGLAIYNLLRDHANTVTINILGVAASAASVIAMAGDTVRIARAGFVMIHNTRIGAAGDRHAMREVADWLEPFDAASVDIYAARTGLDPVDLAQKLDRETWIGGQAAVDAGFADELLPADMVDTGDGAASASMRAEKQIDLMAARSGLTNSARRELLADLKGIKPGADPSGMPGAAEFEKSVLALLDKM